MDKENEVIDPVDTPETEASTHGVEDTTEAAPEPEGEIVIQIGDEEPEPEPEQAPEWVRNLRRENRELQKRLKEIEAAKAQEEAPTLPAKPKLDDFDYDTEAFEAALETWYETKRAVDAKQAKEAIKQEKVQKAWDAKVAAYKEARVKTPFKDYEDSESFVCSVLSEQQQGLIIKHAENPTYMIQALAKNPDKADELSKFDYVDDFTAALLKMEAIVKTTRKPATSPEKTVTVPTGLGVTAADNTLERLREEAAKTGDYSKVMAYRRQMRA